MFETQYSFSTNPDAKGAPTGFSIPVREVRLSAGAEFVVAICGEIMTMPGLPKVPAADSIDTIPALLAVSAEKFASRRAMGVRRTVRMEERDVKVKVDGKEVDKKHKIPCQTDYEWRTYSQFMDKIKQFGSGLMSLNLQHGQRVALFAATRPEWQVAAQGCFLHGLPVVTDPNIPVDQGTGNNEDPVFVVRASDLVLWEGGIRARVMPETRATTLTVLLQIFSYLAFSAGRYPQSIVEITGLTAPTW